MDNIKNYDDLKAAANGFQPWDQAWVIQPEWKTDPSIQTTDAIRLWAESIKVNDDQSVSVRYLWGSSEHFDITVTPDNNASVTYIPSSGAEPTKGPTVNLSNVDGLKNAIPSLFSPEFALAVNTGQPMEVETAEKEEPIKVNRSDLNNVAARIDEALSPQNLEAMNQYLGALKQHFGVDVKDEIIQNLATLRDELRKENPDFDVIDKAVRSFDKQPLSDAMAVMNAQVAQLHENGQFPDDSMVPVFLFQQNGISQHYKEGVAGEDFDVKELWYDKQKAILEARDEIHPVPTRGEGKYEHIDNGHVFGPIDNLRYTLQQRTTNDINEDEAIGENKHYHIKPAIDAAAKDPKKINFEPGKAELEVIREARAVISGGESQKAEHKDQNEIQASTAGVASDPTVRTV